MIRHDIEEMISKLSLEEKQTLFNSLGTELHHSSNAKQPFALALAEMAADPDIQRELQKIEQEFAKTEEDGLEDL